jgi:Na+/H+ antiporter NhaA
VLLFDQDAAILGHQLTLHYIINDIFMVFFFGIATKEVTESCLPGGSLNPPRKAFSPLVATVGGVTGPVAVYLIVTYVVFQAGGFDDPMYDKQVWGGANCTSSAASGDYHDRRMLKGGSTTNLTNYSAAAYAYGDVAAAAGSAKVDDGCAWTRQPLDYYSVAYGWGVPTATDISLAWVVAVQVRPRAAARAATRAARSCTAAAP